MTRKSWSTRTFFVRRVEAVDGGVNGNKKIWSSGEREEGLEDEKSVCLIRQDLSLHVRVYRVCESLIVLE